MKTDVVTLQDTFKIGYEAYEDSRIEAQEILNFFHNRQYNESQLAILANRGQPAETFNIVKMFGRLILGYYSTVVNTIKVGPTQINDILTSSLLNDVVDFTMRSNHFETEGDKVKLDGILQGLMCVYIDVEDTKKRDEFGRIIRRISISHTPAEEIVLDPMSTLEDYSDARFLHRFKWMSEEQLRELIRKYFSKQKTDDLIKRLESYHNHLNIDEAEFENKYNTQFDGYFKRYDNYLVVHSTVIDDDGDVWSVWWSADEELGREKVTYKEVRFPYRVHKIHTSNKTEYYGLFRELIETQKAINQALLKIQLMVNTQKAFVENGGVENLAAFTDQFNRVNAVIPVKSLKKIKIESLTREVIDQYTVIDKALDRIQRVLGVNDSFLGMAFASDSGRKVKLQQNATSLALRYVSVRIEQFYRLLGWDTVNLIKQFYTATQVLKITDETVGDRWIMLNKPMQRWTGKMDANGQPIMDLVWEEVLNPASGEPEIDAEGRVVIAPIPTAETEIAFTEVDLVIDTVIYNDEDEKNQLMLETILQGNIGQLLSQANPAGYFKAAGLAVKTMKTKHSIDISEILEQTAAMIAQSGGVAAVGSAPPASEQPGSASMKLPQNTNEDA
jgi:hypothetical protein